MRIKSTIAAAFAALVAVPVALSGCSLQADWDGTKLLASEQCVLAGRLFTDSDRAELAEALRPYVPEDLHEVLDIYTLPEPAAMGDESEERRAQIVEVLSARSSAEDALRGWAQLSCGPGVVVGEAGEPPLLQHMQSFETELDGVRVITVMGATEPDHAVSLCEQVRLHDTEAQIEVTDLDGFPLALAAADAACGFHPILYEGLDIDAEDGFGVETRSSP